MTTIAASLISSIQADEMMVEQQFDCTSDLLLVAIQHKSLLTVDMAKDDDVVALTY